MPVRLLSRFARTLAGDDKTLDHARDFAAWYRQQYAAPFAPADRDDVVLRNYLLDLRIAGTPRKELQSRTASLKRLYAWIVDRGLLDSSPFDNYNFDRPFLSRDQIRRRRDMFAGDRTARELYHLRALNKLANELNRAGNLKDAMDAALRTLVETMGLQTAWLFLWDKAPLTAHVHPAPEPHDFALSAARNLPPALESRQCHHLRKPPDCWCQGLLRDGLLRRAVNVVECTRLQTAARDAGDTKGLMFHATVPLVASGQPIGLVNIAAEAWQFFTAGDLELLTAAGRMIADTIERAWLFARSVELGAAEERNRLAREIHDTLAQGLTGIALQLETADALLEDEVTPSRARPAVQQALSLTRANLDQARRSVMGLRAAPLEGRTLAGALRDLVRGLPPSKRLKTSFTLAGPDRSLPPQLEMNLYRITQEALNNVLQHARAARANVSLAIDSSQVMLAVEDDGIGFDPSRAPEGHYGLIGMNERARLAGGNLSIDSAAGHGARIRVVVPIPS